ncbi:MAG: hypothetical protein CVT62_02065 [Actinobacteria bacterium HGW-Actinobacteria-2]|nr:MAG: hypothetical protein CVT62_02065 [Actinobacteria bacterium HGW-Actinobacteria-2]
MGFLDKYVQMVSGPAPDMPVLMGGLLAEGDTFLSWTTATPEAVESDGSGGVSSDPFNRLLNMAVKAAVSAHSASKHIGGAEGSIARTLPRDGEQLTLVVSQAGLSAWRGNGYHGNVPEPLYRIAGEHVATVTDTGQRRQGKAAVCRVDFVDGSFFDYCLYINQDEFLEACRKRWGI